MNEKSGGKRQLREKGRRKKGKWSIYEQYIYGVVFVSTNLCLFIIYINFKDLKGYIGHHYMGSEFSTFQSSVFNIFLSIFLVINHFLASKYLF